jgi:hypothetical protein
MKHLCPLLGVMAIFMVVSVSTLEAQPASFPAATESFLFMIDIVLQRNVFFTVSAKEYFVRN